jgi:hypothetical protein
LKQHRKGVESYSIENDEKLMIMRKINEDFINIKDNNSSQDELLVERLLLQTNSENTATPDKF